MALMRASLIVSAMTLLSRVLGFVRDVVIARFFGASGATDAFVLAFRIPNLLRRMFAEGSFSLAFVPVLSEYREQNDQEALKALLDCVSGVLMAILLLVVGLGMLFAPQLIDVFAFGFGEDSNRFELAVGMLRITFPYALLISLTAMAGGILNTFGRFAIPAVTPALLNISMIVSVLVLHDHLHQPVSALAWGVLVGGFIQLALQLPYLQGLGLLPRPNLNWHHSGLRKIFKRMLPTLLGSSAAQLNILIDTMIASTLVVGSMSWLYYSDRLLEFPLGVFGIAISTVILPSLSRLSANNDTQAFAQTIDWGMRLGLLVALPAAAGLIVLAEPITASLFNYGEFDDRDVAMTALSMMAYGAGLPAFVLIKIMAPGFYARGDTRTPVRIALITMGVNLMLNLLFVFLLTRYPIAPAHIGLALASSLAAYLNMSLLFFNLYRSKVIALKSGSWLKFGVTIGLSTTLLALAVVMLKPPMLWWLAASLFDRAVTLLGLILAGGLVYLMGLFLMRLDRDALRR